MSALRALARAAGFAVAILVVLLLVVFVVLTCGGIVALSTMFMLWLFGGS